MSKEHLEFLVHGDVVYDLDDNTWDAIVAMMDDDIREYVHYHYALCDYREFLFNYLIKDESFHDVLLSKFGIELVSVNALASVIYWCGMTVRDLSCKSGVNYRLLLKYINDERELDGMTMRTVKKIACGLGLELSEFVYTVFKD